MELLITFIAVLLFMKWYNYKCEQKRQQAVAASLIPARQSDRIQYLADVDVALCDALEQLDRGVQQPALSPRQYDYLPMPGEQIFAVRPVSLVEPYSKTHYMRLAEGTLFVTNDGIVFQSNEYNDRILWLNVAKIELLPDGYKIHTRIGQPTLYIFAEPNVNFAVTLMLFHEMCVKQHRLYGLTKNGP